MKKHKVIIISVIILGFAILLYQLNRKEDIKAVKYDTKVTVEEKTYEFSLIMPIDSKDPANKIKIEHFIDFAQTVGDEEKGGKYTKSNCTIKPVYTVAKMIKNFLSNVIKQKYPLVDDFSTFVYDSNQLKDSKYSVLCLLAYETNPVDYNISAMGDYRGQNPLDQFKSCMKDYLSNNKELFLTEIITFGGEKTYSKVVIDNATKLINTGAKLENDIYKTLLGNYYKIED